MRSAFTPARWKSSGHSASKTDHEIGRLVKAIEDMGAMDNTLFIYIAGGNGASAEGSMTGMFNEASFVNGVPEQLADVSTALKAGLLGGPCE